MFNSVLEMVYSIEQWRNISIVYIIGAFILWKLIKGTVYASTHDVSCWCDPDSFHENFMWKWAIKTSIV